MAPPHSWRLQHWKPSSHSSFQGLLTLLLLLSFGSRPLPARETPRILLAPGFTIVKQRPAWHPHHYKPPPHVSTAEEASESLPAPGSPLTPVSASADNRALWMEAASVVGDSAAAAQPGRVRMQRMISTLQAIKGKPYSKFIKLLTESGCRTRLEIMLDVYQVTLLVPENAAIQNSSITTVSKQRTCFHALLGNWTVARLTKVPMGGRILTADVWPAARVFNYKLNHPPMQFDGDANRKTGGRLVAKNLYNTSFLIAHGVDKFLLPREFYKGFG